LHFTRIIFETACSVMDEKSQFCIQHFLPVTDSRMIVMTAYSDILIKCQCQRQKIYRRRSMSRVR